MSRDYKVYLEDIVQAIEKIQRYTEGLSLEVLASDEKTLDAVLRNLEVIGEAVKALPEQVRLQGQDVDWKKIAGLRDILIHRYFGIDLDIIWDVIRNRLPVLGERVGKLLEN